MEPTNAARRRIMIADDRQRTRRALRALLAIRPGYDVVAEAADGAETLARVASEQPDVLLVDVYMPIRDGVDVTARVKARWPAIRVVVHSLAVERRQAALAAGADAFVAKGEPLDVLFAALDGHPDAGVDRAGVRNGD